jgi:hypothetical protein
MSLRKFKQSQEATAGSATFPTPSLQKAFDDIGTPTCKEADKDFGLIRMTSELDQQLNNIIEGKSFIIKELIVSIHQISSLQNISQNCFRTNGDKIIY